MRYRSTLRRYCRLSILVGCLTVLTSPVAGAEDLPPPVARAIIHPLFVHWPPQVSYQRLTLNVAIPDGRVIQQELQPGESVGFSLSDTTQGPVLDGQYTYELIVTPVLNPALQQALLKAQETGDDSQRTELQRQGVLPRRSLTQTGYFSVLNGSIVIPPDAD